MVYYDHIRPMGNNSWDEKEVDHVVKNWMVYVVFVFVAIFLTIVKDETNY